MLLLVLCLCGGVFCWFGVWFCVVLVFCLLIWVFLNFYYFLFLISVVRLHPSGRDTFIKEVIP